LVLDLIILILRRVVNSRFKIRPIPKKMFVENINFTKATCIEKDHFLFGEKEKEQRMVRKWHIGVKE
jgi:hypothetical protein